MPWRPLATHAEADVPKVHNLRRASRAGIAVPPTVWEQARVLDSGDAPLPEGIGDAPWIVRSASPDEDTDHGTAAGRFETVAVESGEPTEFRTAVAAVVESLRDGSGIPRGHVFVQPLRRPERGGVAFTDCFYFERTEAPGGNRGLTAGTERGEVTRGHLVRGEPWTGFVERLARAFASELARGANLDIEYAVEGDAYELLQARPARFELARNPLLSQANHREILGELPSPWITEALRISGESALDYFACVDGEVRSWNEAYAVVVGGRPWLNFSFFFRLMDRWGLPRAFVTEGVGGEVESPLDERADLARMVRRSPRLVRLQLQNGLTILRSRAAVERFRRTVDEARDLPELFDATVVGMDVALTTNFAINGALTGLERVRRTLRIRGRAEVVTERMMREFDTLRGRSGAELEQGLDAWLARYGHRGPLESDPARPRFHELRETLRAELERGDGGTASEPVERARSGPLFWLDARRESFRDDLMRVWRTLRARILELARAEVERGRLSAAEDVFLLDREGLAGLADGPAELDGLRAERVGLLRARLPHTATRDAILAALRAEDGGEESAASAAVALGGGRICGRAVVADDLVALLEREATESVLGPDAILVAPALEPSWAVVFGRVGGVLTGLGGELSHVAILLREAGVPALLNAGRAIDAVADGEPITLDLERAVVRSVQTPSESS